MKRSNSFSSTHPGASEAPTGDGRAFFGRRRRLLPNVWAAEAERPRHGVAVR